MDNVIPFNPNPDFLPLTDEEISILEAEGLDTDLNHVNNQVEMPPKELCSLFIIPTKYNTFVGFVSLTESIESREEIEEQLEGVCEAYADNIFDTTQQCIEEMTKEYGNEFSSIIIFC